MHYTPSIALAYLLLAYPLGYLAWGQAATRAVQIGEIQFTIPADMQLELVAGEDLTAWPMLADWDMQGRLLLVESGGVSKPIEEHNKQLLHRIVRLDDHDGDGRFDQRTVVAQDLPFTEGVLCIGRDLLVTAPPSIYRLIDADEDGLYETREVWFDGQTITGCANDLHGPYLGRDGWIYWCKGAFAEQQHALLSGKHLTSSAAHIFRRRLSGGAIEPVMTGGMDNPVEVAITPEGERFFTSTFLHTPGQGQGLRDGIAHAVYGGLYGKDYRKVIDGHVRTGDLMPVMVELGAAAPSGLACLASSQLLPTDRVGQRTLVAALFNLQKVTAQQLQPTGASFTTLNRDLVLADRIDFHPTDVLEDADGSLLIVDTGGWYDLCCPSSRVDQKTAAGGIYRLSPAAETTAARQSMPRQPASPAASQADSDPTQVAQGLAQDLLDDRPWVARGAQLQLLELAASDGNREISSHVAADRLAAITDLLQRQLRDRSLTLDKRQTILWGLCTLGSDRALAAIIEQLSGPDEALVQAACHAVSLHRCTEATASLEQLLGHTSLQVRRAAAEGLGRVGDSNSARKLLASLDDALGEDRHWQHSATYALIELGAVDEALECLSTAQSNTPSLRKQVALLVIDQLHAAERLTVPMLLDGLHAEHEPLRQTASQILAKYPQWAPNYQAAIAEMYQRADDENAPQVTALNTIVTGWRNTATVQELMAKWIDSAPTADRATQRQLLELLSTYANSDLPTTWIEPLARWLQQAEPIRQAEIARELSRLILPESSTLNDQLQSSALATSDARLRLQLLAALPIGSVVASPELEQSLLSALAEVDADHSAGESNDESPENSSPAMTLSNAGLASLQRVRLSAPSGRQLLASLEQQPPRSLPLVVEAISRVGDDALDTLLLQQLSQLPAARTLGEEQLLNLYRSRSAALQQTAQETVASLTRPPSDVQEKIDSLLAQLKPGDPIRGLQLFRSNKTACSGCHRLGYVGGEIGPNLTHIGSSRTRPALLEAILFPSARLEQSFQPTKVLTHDGQVYNGLITRHLSPTQFMMQLTADKSIVLSTDDVARQEASQVSIMPSGLAELLTPEELSDLMAILESAK